MNTLKFLIALLFSAAAVAQMPAIRMLPSHTNMIPVIQAADMATARAALGVGTGGGDTDWTDAPLVNPSVSGVTPTNIFRWLDELESVMSVKAFDAKGDGTTDDTAAILAAAEAADGKTLFFPAGTYRVINGVITNVVNSHWVGEPGAVIKVLDQPNTPVWTGPATGISIASGNIDGAIHGIDRGFTAIFVTNTMGGATFDMTKIEGFSNASYNGLKQRPHGTATFFELYTDSYCLTNNIDATGHLGWLTWTNTGTVTITAMAAHGKSPGNSVVLSGIMPELNGTHTIVATPTTTNFTISVAFPALTLTRYNPEVFLRFDNPDSVHIEKLKFDCNPGAGPAMADRSALLVKDWSGAVTDTIAVMVNDCTFRGLGGIGQGMISYAVKYPGGLAEGSLSVRDCYFYDLGEGTAAGAVAKCAVDIDNCIVQNDGEYGFNPQSLTGETGGAVAFGVRGPDMGAYIAGPVNIRNCKVWGSALYGGGFNCKPWNIENSFVYNHRIRRADLRTGGSATGYRSHDYGAFNGTGLGKIDDGATSQQGTTLTMRNVQLINSAPCVLSGMQVEVTLYDNLKTVIDSCWFDRPIGAILNVGQRPTHAFAIKNTTLDMRGWRRWISGPGDTITTPNLSDASMWTNVTVGAHSVWDSCRIMLPNSDETNHIVPTYFQLSNSSRVTFKNCYFSNVGFRDSGGAYVLFDGCIVENTKALSFLGIQMSTLAARSEISVVNTHRVGDFAAYYDNQASKVPISSWQFRNCTLDKLPFSSSSLGLLAKDSLSVDVVPFVVIENSTMPELYGGSGPTYYGGTTNMVSEITVANLPSDGNTVVIAGETRTWRTTPSNAQTELLIGATVAECAANLRAQLALTNTLPCQPIVHVVGAKVTVYGWMNQAVEASQTGTALTLAFTGLTNKLSSGTGLFSTSGRGNAITDFNDAAYFSLSYRTNLTMRLVVQEGDSLVHGAKLVTPTGANITGPATVSLRCGTDSIWRVDGPTMSGVFQPADADLTALAANPQLYQSTNVDLTSLTSWVTGNDVVFPGTVTANGFISSGSGTSAFESMDATNSFKAQWATADRVAVFAGTTPYLTNTTFAASDVTLLSAQTYQATNANLTSLAGASGVTGTGNAMRTRTGVVREIWISAGSMVPSTTSPAAAATNVWATTTDGQTLDAYDFDAGTDESVQFTLTLPLAWDASTIKAKVFWKPVNATSGTVDWNLAGGSATDNETGGNTLGTVVEWSDTAQTSTNTVHITAASGAVTVGGTPSVGHLVWFKLSRDADDGTNDTMANDARLLGVQIQYTETTSEPSAW